MELPYKMYRLVKADGAAAERVEKHPFCMSRVFYDGKERPEEVWAELADGSCRWRQTGSEVKVIALKVQSFWVLLVKQGTPVLKKEDIFCASRFHPAF